ncbi:hypothetical protein EO92_04855 [Methanosarcina sp. 2.H.A.1B.4]|nr:hypothetical protein EO92_04855 [Methanosarcina sp. 2.H.A.1B.4]
MRFGIRFPARLILLFFSTTVRRWAQALSGELKKGLRRHIRAFLNKHQPIKKGVSKDNNRTKIRQRACERLQKQKFGSILKTQFEFARNPYSQAMNTFN